MISYEIGLFTLLVSLVVSRIISAKATKSISAQQKAEIVDKFSGFAAYGLIPFIVIIAAYFLLAKYTEMDRALLTWLYLGILVILIVGTQIYSIQKLKELNLDSRYMKMYTVARVVSLTGFAVFIIAVLPL